MNGDPHMKLTRPARRPHFNPGRRYCRTELDTTWIWE
jgi:hypothetical protein